VIQNLDVIHGRPSWRAVFLMGMVNASGRFSPLQFKVETTGQPKTVQLEIEKWEGPQGARKKVVIKKPWTFTPTRCIAWAKSRATGEVVEGPPVSYDMALEEGWVAKDGSKWLTELRELMLRYRAASFFAKVHASDLTLGMQTTEEALDVGPAMRNVTPAGDHFTPATPQGNPYVDAPAESAPATEVPAEEAKPSPKPRKKAEPKEEAPEEPVQEAEVLPSRKEMYANLKALIAQAEISPQTAEARIKKAGLIPEGKTLAETTDAELFEIMTAAPSILLPQAEETQTPETEEA
jgi:hypothetical protein